MCIRDSRCSDVVNVAHALHVQEVAVGVDHLRQVRSRQMEPVSYKHLTRPTSDLVLISVGPVSFKKKKI